jgi:hypothetical protein
MQTSANVSRPPINAERICREEPSRERSVGSPSHRLDRGDGVLLEAEKVERVPRVTSTLTGYFVRSKVDVNCQK